MTVRVLGTPVTKQDGETYSAEPGRKGTRLLLFIVNMSGTTNGAYNYRLYFGGKQVKMHCRNYHIAQARSCAIYFLLDREIMGGARTIDIPDNYTSTDNNIACLTLDGVNQNNPFTIQDSQPETPTGGSFLTLSGMPGYGVTAPIPAAKSFAGKAQRTVFTACDGAVPFDSTMNHTNARSRPGGLLIGSACMYLNTSASIWTDPTAWDTSHITGLDGLNVSVSSTAGALGYDSGEWTFGTTRNIQSTLNVVGINPYQASNPTLPSRDLVAKTKTGHYAW
jgi:hypothetical protein